MAERTRPSMWGHAPGSAGAAVFVVLAAGLGLLAVWLGSGPAHLADAAPHLVAGWTVLGCGVIGWSRAPWSRCGPLLAAAGLAWFATDLSTCLNIEPLSHRCLAIAPVGTLARALAWAWLGILAQAVLTFPEGRLHTRPTRMAACVAWLAVLAMPVLPGPATLVVVACLAAIPWLGRLRAWPAEHTGSGTRAFAGSILSLGLALDITGLLPPNALELGVAVASIGLLAGLLAIEERRRTLSLDRAVELGDALALAIGDPSLGIGIRTPDGWRDAAGRPATAPTTGPGIAVTPVERDGEVLGAIAHDPGALTDPEVRAAVLGAVELVAHQVRLRSALDAQAAEVARSRRRLADAALGERRTIGSRMEIDVGRRIAEVAALLTASRELATPEVAPLIADSETALRRANGEIEAVLAGLYPAALGRLGLAGALRDLAARTPGRVEVQAPDGVAGGTEVDATLWFVCAEALTNLARHAPRASARIRVERTAGAVTVVIADDGPGGADPLRGTGLRGLRDRVEAMGGTLVIDSPPGMGTRLAATIPVSPEARPTS